MPCIIWYRVRACKNVMKGKTVVVVTGLSKLSPSWKYYIRMYRRTEICLWISYTYINKIPGTIWFENCVYVCVRLCVCMCVWICIYLCLCVCERECGCERGTVYIIVWVWVRQWLCVCVCVCVYGWMCVCVCVCASIQWVQWRYRMLV